MAALRSPEGCPWDQEQDHQTLRWHAVEEVYELLDAIEAHDDVEMAEELGDLLLQVVFHAQLARERKAFDFDAICQRLADKLVRRHPHVFGDVQVKDVDQVWANWESIKRAEKSGTRHERQSALDGVPKHLPALMRAQKLFKKAAKAGLSKPQTVSTKASKAAVAEQLCVLAELCQQRGWSAEEMLQGALRQRERTWRRDEARLARAKKG
ncbi:MAG: nucleoside triphosphate pyrophosphohydrolase [Verrucomicrobiota bacterium]|jgi:MazG family protein